MKGFLLDENLPTRLRFTPSLSIVPFSALGASPSDSEVWEYARREEWVIVTKDADFSGRIILHEAPPWGVRLRFGNLRRSDFHALLARVWPQVEGLLKNSKLVNVHADHVEGIG